MAGRGGFARELCTKSAREGPSNGGHFGNSGNAQLRNQTSDGQATKTKTLYAPWRVSSGGCARLAVHWACTARSPSLQKVLILVYPVHTVPVSEGRILRHSQS